MIRYEVDQSWRDRAACIGKPTQRWFLGRESEMKGAERDYSVARAICEGCPVRLQCLEEGLHSPMIDHGMWGGLSPRERRALRRTKYAVTSKRISYNRGTR